MQEAASISPPGSMVIANFITADGLKRLHGAHQAAQAAANTAPDTNSSSTGTVTEAPDDSSSGSESAAANGLPSGARSSNAQSSSDKGGGDGAISAGADTTGAVGVGGVDAGSSSNSSSRSDGDARKAAAEGDLHKSGLTSHFKWGCPDNVEEVRSTRDVLVLL